jgi:hypothetical protein
MVPLGPEAADPAAPSDEDVIAHYTERLGPEAIEDARSFAAELVEREFRIGRLERLADELLWRPSLSGEEIEVLGLRPRMDNRKQGRRHEDRPPSIGE